MTTILVDLETYATRDLTKTGVYAYVEDPAFEVLMMAYSVDGQEPSVAVGEQEVRAQLPDLLAADRLVAHNAGFDRVALGVLDPRLQDPARWVDTMALAAAAGYPAKLEKLAKALKVEEKDTAGTRLINLFSKPYRGRRVMPDEKPDEWAAFVEYCRQDVATLVAVARKLPPLLPAEQALWVVDQQINDRGIRVDLEMARRAVAAAEVNKTEQEAEVRALTGVSNPNSVQQLGAWLGMPSLAAAAVEEALEAEPQGPRRRVLELRQDLALSASAKYEAALVGASDDGRLRGQFRFHGAHTGRWSGRGVQLQNLPRHQAEHPEAARLDLALGLGADALTLKGLIRSLFVGPFIVVDYSAIEARVLAWLAGEAWALEAFAAGRDIYLETAERMGMPGQRQKGKVAVLALGYEGGVGALRKMGGAKGTDDELDMLKVQWRNANPNITRFWRRMGDAFWTGGPVGRHVHVEAKGGDRRIVLPSGRPLVYHGVHWQGGGLAFQDPKGFVTETYGGRLTENVTQAVARDVLADALLRTPDVVGHVHDEVIVEGDHTVEEIEKILTDGPAWAEGLPLNAEGFVTERYRKG